MKLTQLALLLLPVLATAYTEAEYDDGKVHQMIMDRKHVWLQQFFHLPVTNVNQGILGEAQKLG